MTKPIFILFYMNGCVHCENFMNSKEWEKIKARKNLICVQMEASESSLGESNFIRGGDEYMENQHKAEKIQTYKTNNVRGYPTLAKVVGNGEPIEYNGESRTAKDILEWVLPKKVGGKQRKPKTLKYLSTAGGYKTRKSCCWDFFEF